MSTIDIFPWNDNFNTGIQIIDEQHKVLVKILNQLASHIAFNTDIPTLNIILDELADYTVFHFQTEEGIWHQHFPDDSLEIDHKKTHDSFVETISQAKEQITSESEDSILEGLLSFLTRWLTTHILENDRYLAAVVFFIQSGLSLEAAKTKAREHLGGETKVLVDLILNLYEKLSINTLSLMRELRNKKEQEELITLYNSQLKQHTSQLESMFMKTVALTTTLCEMRDPYTVGHEQRVAEISVAIGAEMGLDSQRIEGLKVGGYLHDLGKMCIPLEILSKPGKLSPIEFMLIKQHPQAGYDVLKDIGFPWPVEQIALQHHERMDGSGYPNGLKGDEILLEARIVAVADVIESMSTHRPYRSGLGIEAALAEIERGIDTAYDRNVVECCLRLFRDNDFKLPS
ncbi:MAG: bacteriohemerythrin [Methylococcales bacterium]